jgi:hypothetical protein
MNETTEIEPDQIRPVIDWNDKILSSEEKNPRQDPKEPEWANPFNWIIGALMTAQIGMFIAWWAGL